MTAPAEAVRPLVDTGQNPARFIGSKCPNCGSVAFPPRQRCSGCARTGLEPTLISPTGEIYSYTVVHLGRPGVTVPYAVAVADFPGGVRVFAQVLGWQKGITIGQAVTAAEAPADERTGAPAADFRLQPVGGRDEAA